MRLLPVWPRATQRPSTLELEEALTMLGPQGMKRQKGWEAWLNLEKIVVLAKISGRKT